jgi:hypothetical protein
VDLAVAIFQVVAVLAAVAAVALALVTLREAKTERREERDWRREERRERRLDQLQEVAVLVDEIIDTFPNLRTVDRDRLQLRLRVKLKGVHWTSLEKTQRLADHVRASTGEDQEKLAEGARLLLP